MEAALPITEFFPAVTFKVAAFFLSFFGNLWNGMRDPKVWRGAFCILLAFVLIVGVVGCSISQVQSDIQKVLALLPSVAGIAASILSMLAAYGVTTSAASTTISNVLTGIKNGFSDAQAILSAYQNNIASMPTTTLNQLDTILAAIQSEIATIQQQFPQLSPAVVTAINVGIGTLETILGYFAVILPAPVAQMMFPRAYAALTYAGIKFGSQSMLTVIPSQREFADAYNSKIKALHKNGVKGIHKNWVRVLHVPVMP